MPGGRSHESSIEVPISPKLVDVFCVLEDLWEDDREVLRRSVIDAKDVEVLGAEWLLSRVVSRLFHVSSSWVSDSGLGLRCRSPSPSTVIRGKGLGDI